MTILRACVYIHTVTRKHSDRLESIHSSEQTELFIVFDTIYQKDKVNVMYYICMYEKIWNLLFALVFRPCVAMHAVWQWWQQEVFLGVICTPGFCSPSSLQIPSKFVVTVFLWSHFSWDTQGHYLSQSQSRIILCSRSFWHWMKNLFSWQSLCAGFLQGSFYIWLYSTSVMLHANLKACCWE